MIEFVSALLRSKSDAQLFADALQFELGETARLKENKCELIPIVLGGYALYFLIPDYDSPLYAKLERGNHYFSLGVGIGNDTVEITDDLTISQHSELMSYHELWKKKVLFKHDWIKKLDHVLFVTQSLKQTEEILQRKLGIQPDPKYSHWYFPDYDVTDMTYRLNEVFLEFNQPHTSEGLFGQYLQQRGESLFALAFEAMDIAESVERLKLNGVRVGEPMPIRAVSPETQNEEIIEHSVTLSLKSTAGLRVIITDMSWL